MHAPGGSLCSFRFLPFVPFKLIPASHKIAVFDSPLRDKVIISVAAINFISHYFFCHFASQYLLHYNTLLIGGHAFLINYTPSQPASVASLEEKLASIRKRLRWNQYSLHNIHFRDYTGSTQWPFYCHPISPLWIMFASIVSLSSLVVVFVFWGRLTGGWSPGGVSYANMVQYKQLLNKCPSYLCSCCCCCWLVYCVPCLPATNPFTIIYPCGLLTLNIAVIRSKPISFA